MLPLDNVTEALTSVPAKLPVNPNLSPVNTGALASALETIPVAIFSAAFNVGKVPALNEPSEYVAAVPAV